MMWLKKYLAFLPDWNSTLPVRLAWLFILIIGLFAIFGPFVANEKPYYCKLEGKNYYPIFSGISEATLSTLHPDHSPVNWYTTEFESVWYAPIPYSHFTIDLASGKHVSPFAKQDQKLRLRHWLGTDLVARDVAAGMIRGCRISLLIGLGSMLLALLIGIPLGALSAYWGNKGWRATWLQIIIGIITIGVLCYIIWLHVATMDKLLLIVATLSIGVFAIYFSGRMKSKSSSLPVDHFIMGAISIIDSFPGLFIVLILLVIVPVKGWVIVMCSIALLRWPVMARYMRAEVFKMKESNYIKAAQGLNIPHMNIMTTHIIPYAFRPVMISLIFGIASAILAESSLSFLGIGLPPEELNWGRLLAQSRNYFHAWWLVLFPGCAIFFTLLSLYTLGNEARNKLENSD